MVLLSDDYLTSLCLLGIMTRWCAVLIDVNLYDNQESSHNRDLIGMYIYRDFISDSYLMTHIFILFRRNKECKSSGYFIS